MAKIEDIDRLVEAMDQILDDMGPHGASVCLATKAQARVAFQPFMSPDAVHIYMPLDEAKRILAEADQ